MRSTNFEGVERFRFPGLVILAIAMLLGISSPARAQEITGGITGTITDPSGAAIPGAMVIATDVAQGTTWPTQTNSAGVYNLPRLPIGEYSIKVAAKGFATAIKPPFQLQMNQVARVEVKLSLGAVTQTVSVNSAPPLLQTDTMQVGYVTSANFNDNLPLATRDFAQLTLLTPGVTTTDPSSFTNGMRTMGGGRPYVNGNREESNNFLLDGIDNNQVSDNLMSYQPSVDAIQQFDVITNNAPAQYGQFQGGVISVTLKSGTNNYHGDAFEFLRNDALNANNWANDWQGLPKPGLRWNTFGGTFGGPVKKDKLFFFVDYQGERLDSPPAIQFFTVMTPAERTGDFSQLLSEKSVQLYNPCASFSGPCTTPANPTAVRQPFANNMIPTSMLDPVAQKLFASGDYPNPVNSNLLDNAFNTQHTYTDNDQGDVKIDYMMNAKNHVWGSYSEGFQQNPTTNSVLILGQDFNNSPFHAGVIDWTHILSPTLVMDSKMGVNRIYLDTGAAVTGLGNFAQSIGIGDGNIHGAGLPGICFNGGAAVGNCASNGFASAFGTEDNEELFADTTVEPTVDLILTHNRHVIHMGFEAMRHDINTYYAGNNGKYGFLSYSGQYTSGPNPAGAVSNGLPEADFMLGLPSDVGLGVNGGTWGQRSWVYAPYVQDDWRVTDRLTLNLGLRWEYNQPWYEVYNRQANFGLLSGTEYLAAQSNCPYSNCRALYNAYWRDWEPRVGFAYTPSFLGKSTVVRGAYSVSSFLEGTGTNLRLPLNPPFQTEYENIYSSTAAPYTQYFPGSTSGEGLSVLTAPANPLSGANVRLWDPNVRPNSVQQWNFSVEHQFPDHMLFSLGYIGQHGTHLMVPMPYFQERLPGEAGCPASAATPCGSPYLAGNPAVYDVIGQISGTASNGDQAYDALQASLSKHLSQGLEFQLSYTYSKAMTNSIGYYGQGGQAASNSAYWQNLYDMAAEWGPTYFNDANLLAFSYVYQLPFGLGERFGNTWNPAVTALLGNWQLSGIVSAHSGFPMTINATDASGTNSRGPRANCLGPNSYPNGVGEGTTWFATSPFAQPAAGTFGSCANGTVIGPGLRDWDLGVSKQFSIGESRRLEFRTEFINFTNTPIFNAPNTTVTSATFGEVLTSQGERNIQFALKLYF
jgi:hypothetical protein